MWVWSTPKSYANRPVMSGAKNAVTKKVIMRMVVVQFASNRAPSTMFTVHAPLFGVRKMKAANTSRAEMKLSR